MKKAGGKMWGRGIILVIVVFTGATLQSKQCITDGPLEKVNVCTAMRREVQQHNTSEFIHLSWLHSRKTAAAAWRGAERATPHQLPSIGLIILTLPELIHTSQARLWFLASPVAAPQTASLSGWWSTSSLWLRSQRELLSYFPLRAKDC